MAWRSPWRVGWRRARIGAFLAIAMAGVLWLAGCSSRESISADEPTDPDLHKGPVLENMAARIYNGENLESVVRAERSIFDLAKSEALLYAVRVSFYRDGQWAGDVQGKRGIMYFKEQPRRKISKHDIFLDGGVAYKDKDGMTFTAPQLRYTARTGQLASGGGEFEQRRRVDNTEYILRGKSFTTNRDLTTFSGEGAKLVIRAANPGNSREPKQ